MDQDKLLIMLRKSPWVRRRLIFRSLKEKEYLMKNKEEFKSAFDFLDVDKDGFITCNDLTVIVMLMEGEVPKLTDVNRWIRVFDVNHDLKICFEEFVATLIVKMEHFMTPPDIVDLFSKCDLKNRGYITCHNVIQATALSGKRITVEDARLMFKEIGPSWHRRITFMEFERVMKIMRKDILFCVGAILAT